MSSAGRRFFDPLYGHVALDDLEWSLVQTPEFQRLRGVRMCNINSMLISGASEISRFEHSVGVLRLAQMWGEAAGLTGDEYAVLRAAALLHDMQTGPFGHSLQYVVEDNRIGNAFVHDDILHGYQEQFHQRLLATAGYKGSVFSSPRLLARLWPRVAEAIKGQGRVGPLISGTLDLDNLDNVIRLAYHVGIASTDDVRQIPEFVRSLSIRDGELSAPAYSIPFIERWQAVRQRLYELLLLDWAEFSAKAMLTLAIEKAFEHGLLDQQSWLLTDQGLLDHLERRGVGELQTIGEVVRRLRVGNLYQPALLVSTVDIELYKTLASTSAKRTLEREISDQLRSQGRQPGKLLVHFILDHKKTCRSVAIRLQNSGERITVGRDSRKLLIGVFSSVELGAGAKEQILNALKKAVQRYSTSDFLSIPDPVSSDDAAAKQLQQLSLSLD